MQKGKWPISAALRRLTNQYQLVDSIFVNLVDLVDMPNTGVLVRLFETEGELSKYTKRKNKIFPREDARAGGLLKHLLRQIARPRRGGKTKAKTSETPGAVRNPPSLHRDK